MRSLTFDEVFAILSAVRWSAADLARLRAWLAGGRTPLYRMGALVPAWDAVQAASRAAMTSSTWPSTFTFGKILRRTPFSSIRKVARWMPIYFLP